MMLHDTSAFFATRVPIRNSLNIQRNIFVLREVFCKILIQKCKYNLQDDANDDVEIVVFNILVVLVDVVSVDVVSVDVV
jgi:hypothetical protein